LDSVLVDGASASASDYCYDLVSGWVSLGQAATDSIVVYYQYSFKSDLAFSNWDTYNMALANTSKPYVDFFADTAFGWAPLAVQFTDSSLGADDWLWRFGDGDSSAIRNPSHIFDQGGAYDIRLDVNLPDGAHNRTRRKMIITLADTLSFPALEFVSSDTMKVPVYLTNAHPLYDFVLPVSYGGEVDLKYAGFDTDSCRTDCFADVFLSGYSASGKKAAFTFLSGGVPPGVPLEPGSGPVINVYLVHEDGAGANELDTTSLTANELFLNADYAQYRPRVSPGTLLVAICGDVNGDGTGPNLADITHMIDFVYLGGEAPPNMKAANVNGSSGGIINLSDITYLISFVYLDGPDPTCR
jgi:PKD repeat protein